MTLTGSHQAFFEKALASSTDECILWPFPLQPTGYARTRLNGVCISVHRAVCIESHGPCPENHETAHSCGAKACINPRHVSWKTKIGNEQDKKKHGTDNAGERNGKAKLTWEAVAQIRALRGKKRQIDLAVEFCVSVGVICKIQLNQIWRIPSDEDS